MNNVENNPRITYLTAGAAGMYCGSCMHDNTLAQSLTDQGYPTMLVPTYTPIRTDEKEVSVDQVFFGGINVYLQEKIPLFRFVPRFMDRLLDNPRLIRKVTSRGIETDAKMLGGLTVSMLKGKSGHQRKEVRRLVQWLSHEAKPEILILSNALIGGFIPELKRHLNVPVIVTLQGDDIFLDSLAEPYRSQAIELMGDLDRHVDGYLVHSRFYADHMAQDFGLCREKMYVTPLGIDTRDFVGLLRSREKAETLNIGYLARLSEDKGLHNLVSAFIELKKKPQMEHLNLNIAGWLGKDHEVFAEAQFQRLHSAGLTDAFCNLGSVDRAAKLRMLSDLDILCVPTEYREPKGLYVLEALACGVPVVQPQHGVFPELLGDLSGGLLYQPGELDDLQRQLMRMINDPELRESLGQQGRRNVLERRNAQAMAECTIAIVQQVLAEKAT